MTVTTHVESLDRSIHRTNAWLKALEQRGGWSRREDAYEALRGTLHALRDRMPPDEAVHLAAQMPALVRGVYYDGWKPSGTPLRIRSREEFLETIRRRLGAVDPEQAAHAVFGLLATEVSEGELDDVRNALPEDIRQLWTESAVS